MQAATRCQSYVLGEPLEQAKYGISSHQILNLLGLIANSKEQAKKRSLQYVMPVLLIQERLVTFSLAGTSWWRANYNRNPSQNHTYRDCKAKHGVSNPYAAPYPRVLLHC